MKLYWPISTLLLAMSCALAIYIGYQMEIFGYSNLGAAPEPKTSTNTSGAMTDEEVQLRRRERALAEKEQIVSEQLSRYEKLVVELRTKLEKEGKECQVNLSDKERTLKAKIQDLERETKELKRSKDQALNDLTRSRDSEIQKINEELQKQKDFRAETYVGIYEKMESKKAAKILDEMEMSLAAKILENLKQDKAADILSKMNTERARLITEKSHPRRQPASKKISIANDINANSKSDSELASESKPNPAMENIPKGGE